MKSKYSLLLFTFVTLITCIACKKQLEKKPDSNVLVPTTPVELQGVLDYSDLFGYGHTLGVISADEFYFSDNYYKSKLSNTERRIYAWEKDIFDPTEVHFDWARAYQQIYSANVVLERLQFLNTNNRDRDLEMIKGDALFKRALSHFTLTGLFSVAYDKATASTDLGIQLKLKTDENEPITRPSLQYCYDRILSDCKEAKELLPVMPDLAHRNRASQVAASALMARIFLSMGDWQESAIAAEEVLQRYDSLIDYNNVNPDIDVPIEMNNREVIYPLKAPDQNDQNNLLLAFTKTNGSVDTNLIQLYEANDLRPNLFYHYRSASKMWSLRSSLMGTFTPFQGICVSEMYLTLAECYARLGRPDKALSCLQNLLLNRYKTGSDLHLPHISQPDAILDCILIERQKELAFKGQRWSDIKRLNKQNRNIIQRRIVDGQTRIIEANDPRYALPLPAETVKKYQLQQNPR